MDREGVPEVLGLEETTGADERDVQRRHRHVW